MHNVKFFSEPRRVKRTVVGNYGRYLDEWEEVKTDILSQLKDQGCKDEDITINDNGISLSNGQFFMKPKIHRTMVGTIVNRSADSVFQREDGGVLLYGKRVGKDALRDFGAEVSYTEQGFSIKYELLE